MTIEISDYLVPYSNEGLLEMIYQEGNYENTGYDYTELVNEYISRESMNFGWMNEMPIARAIQASLDIKPLAKIVEGSLLTELASGIEQAVYDNAIKDIAKALGLDFMDLAKVLEAYVYNFDYVPPPPVFDSTDLAKQIKEYVAIRGEI